MDTIRDMIEVRTHFYKSSPNGSHVVYGAYKEGLPSWEVQWDRNHPSYSKMLERLYREHYKPTPKDGQRWRSQINHGTTRELLREAMINSHKTGDFGRPKSEIMWIYDKDRDKDRYFMTERIKEYIHEHPDFDNESDTEVFVRPNISVVYIPKTGELLPKADYLKSHPSGIDQDMLIHKPDWADEADWLEMNDYALKHQHGPKILDPL